MAARVLAEPALLMTMTDVAELADVQRPVVINWRRRTGFPVPPEGTSAAAVQPAGDGRLAAATGRIEPGAGRTGAGLFMLAGLAARYDGPDVIAAVTALLCLRYLAGENDRYPTVPAIRSLRLMRWP